MLLRQDRVVGKGAAQTREDLGLRALVHLGHEVGGHALVGDAPDAGDLVAQEMAGRARDVDAPTLLATNGVVHQEMLGVLKEVRG